MHPCTSTFLQHPCCPGINASMHKHPLSPSLDFGYKNIRAQKSRPLGRLLQTKSNLNNYFAAGAAGAAAGAAGAFLAAAIEASYCF